MREVEKKEPVGYCCESAKVIVIKELLAEAMEELTKSNLEK